MQENIYLSKWLILGCPPPTKNDTNYGKNCNGTCMNGNKGYSQLNLAWEACRHMSECTSIMKWTNGWFYLRRSIDVDVFATNIHSYTFQCGEYAILISLCS